MERERVGGCRSVGEAGKTGGHETCSQDEECQRGCSPSPLLPPWLAAGVLIIFLALSRGSPGGGRGAG